MPKDWYEWHDLYNTEPKLQQRLEQLKENIESINVVLDKDILAELDSVHTQYPNPAP